jgi:glycosyltransferase involved in cell wall biosynthesis
MLRLVANRPHSRLILQTDHDRRIIETLGVKPETITVIRGAGVDLREFQPSPEPGGKPVVLLACRLLWDKGVGDFVEAARRLHERGLAARFILVGQPDPDNPRSIAARQIDAWQKEGHIEWWGHRSDMPSVFAASTLVCLPTVYGEGVPKALIEAAACARPLVATDLPGCREIVRHNDNGLIVPAHDPAALADAIESLLADRQRRMQMGQRSRAIAEAEFGIKSVVDQTLSVYEKAMQVSGHALPPR